MKSCFDQDLFIPSHRQHKLLANIADGLSNKQFDFSDKVWDEEDLCKSDARAELRANAWDYYIFLVDGLGENNPYLEITKPMRFSHEEYQVEATLTDLGIEALKKLRAGYVWDNMIRDISIHETLIYYQVKLRRKTVERVDIDIVSNMAKKDHRLQSLNSEAMLVMMSGRLTATQVVVD